MWVHQYIMQHHTWVIEWVPTSNSWCLELFADSLFDLVGCHTSPVLAVPKGLGFANCLGEGALRSSEVPVRHLKKNQFFLNIFILLLTGYRSGTYCSAQSGQNGLTKQAPASSASLPSRASRHMHSNHALLAPQCLYEAIQVWSFTTLLWTRQWSTGN
jgi:hypothetical protein